VEDEHVGMTDEIEDEDNALSGEVEEDEGRSIQSQFSCIKISIP
jgi:hypothetical protein